MDKGKHRLDPTVTVKVLPYFPSLIMSWWSVSGQVEVPFGGK